MSRKKIMPIVTAVLLLSVLTGCQSGEGMIPETTSRVEQESAGVGELQTSGEQETRPEQVKNGPDAEPDQAERGADIGMEQSNNQADAAPEQGEAPVLLYMGQASIRITTPEDKVIYIDPYAGSDEDYEPSADLILVTHAHFDHSDIDKVVNRKEDCQIITQDEAIQPDGHVRFDLGYVTVQPVEAGYNSMHDITNSVGYVLTFSNGKSVYVTGDTSKTEQMAEMSEMNIDYAFYCCDGVYNMGLEEAAECAELVGAKHNIPYHNTTTNTGDRFDRELALQFDAPNRLIVGAGEEILVE